MLRPPYLHGAEALLIARPSSRLGNQRADFKRRHIVPDEKRRDFRPVVHVHQLHARHLGDLPVAALAPTRPDSLSCVLECILKEMKTD